MFNPLILQGLYYAYKHFTEEDTRECCKGCKSFREGHDYCKKHHYVGAKSYYCSDKNK